jgi:hypothetical protein
MSDRHNLCDRANFAGFFLLYGLRFFWDYLTAESAEDTEGEMREIDVSYANGFDITSKPLATFSNWLSKID